MGGVRWGCGKAWAGVPALSLPCSLASRGLVPLPSSNLHSRAPGGSSETGSVNTLAKLVQDIVSSCIQFPGTWDCLVLFDFQGPLVLSENIAKTWLLKAKKELSHWGWGFRAPSCWGQSFPCTYSCLLGDIVYDPSFPKGFLPSAFQPS